MRKNVVKLLFDVLLSISFVLLFNTKVLGLPFHEIVGIGIGLGIFFHVFLNIRWVKKVTLRLFNPKLPIKTRLGYILNLLLLIAFITIIVSGLFISKVLFPHLRVGNEGWFRTLHISVSYLTLILIGIHVGLHWKWIMIFFKNLLKIQSSRVTRFITRLSIMIILLFGGYQIVATNFATQIASISNVFTMTNLQNVNVHDGFQEKSHDTFESHANGLQQRPRGGEDGGRGHGFDHASPERSKGPFQSPNVLNVFGIIIKYTGIMGLFAFLTYSIEKLLTRMKTTVTLC